tara:strand:+ start:41 stop:280 length:240 start_codon:yes stop_codon:yes gene_type:complete
VVEEVAVLTQHLLFLSLVVQVAVVVDVILLALEVELLDKEQMVVQSAVQVRVVLVVAAVLKYKEVAVVVLLVMADMVEI